MKIRHLTLLLFTAGTVAACSSEDDLFGTSSSSLKEYVLTASVKKDTPKTRVGFDENGKFYWSKNDKIGVTSTDNATAFDTYTLSAESVGQASGTFTGSSTSEPSGYAVYPYNSNDKVTISEGGAATLTYYLPNSYTYTKVDETFFTASKGEGNSFNAPMWGAVSDGSISMKHLGGVFCIKVKSMPSASGTFKMQTGLKIGNTKFSVELPGDGTTTPELTTTASTSATYNTVTFTYSGATAEKPGVFYVPVPTGTYTGVVFTIGSQTINGAESYTIKRGSLYPIEIGSYTLDGEVVKSATTTQAAEEVLKASDAVEITALGNGTTDNNSTASLTIPAKNTEEVSSDEETTKTLIVSKVAENTTLKVEAEGEAVSDNTSDKVAVENITVTLPNTTVDDDDDATDLNLKAEISTPNSTTTIKALEGETVVAELIAETAENTLVIEDGVEIKKLIIRKGNVNIKKGGKVGTIERADNWNGTSGKKTKILIGKGATFDATGLDTSNFEIVDSNDETSSNAYITSLTDFLLGSNTDGATTFTLDRDLALDAPLLASAERTLDLNGYSIKPSDDFTYAKIDGTPISTDDALIMVRRGAKLTIKDSGNDKGSVDSDNKVLCAIKVTIAEDETDATISNKTATLVVDGGTIKGKSYAISGNVNRENTDITINGGKFLTYNEDECAIYQPQVGKLTITGGTIKGATAVEVRAGDATISGGTLEGTSAAAKYSANSGGAATQGMGLAIAQHNTKKAINVNITGGTFKGVYSLFERNVMKNDADAVALVKISVDGGYFTTKMSSENFTGFVSKITVDELFTGISTYASGSADKAAEIILKGDLKMNGFTNLYNKAVNLILDLDGHTITASTTSTFKMTGKDNKLCIKNGTINSPLPSSGKTTDSPWLTFGQGTYTLEDLTINTTRYATAVMSQNEVANLTVKNSSISGVYYSFSTNATVNSKGTITYGQDAVLSFEKVKFESPETGFMANVPLTATFTDCSFKGNHQGALLRGGSYTFKGTNVITLNAELTSTHDDCRNNSNWGDGNKTAFAPLVIGNDPASTAYQYPTTVAFNGDYTSVLVKDGTYADSYPYIYLSVNSEANYVSISGYIGTAGTISDQDIVSKNQDYLKGNVEMKNVK
jgi:hypothetical protein